jgi:hypothetical protein
MKECFALVPIAFGLQQNSLFKKPFDDVFNRLVEAGIVEKMKRDSTSSLGILVTSESTAK